MTTANLLTKSVHPIGAPLDSEHLAELARQALVAEAELTPKPGLVDRRGSGPHTDLSLELMRLSASAIAPYFAAISTASCGSPFDCTLRAELASIGRAAESAMLRTTGGSNTHKGAIWILGLLIAAASDGERRPRHLAENAGLLARLPDRAQPQLVSHGDLVRSRFGAAGARGEAYANFPHVVSVGLPALRAARIHGRTESNSRLHALLSIMALLEDTCVLYRGGVSGLNTVKIGATRVLDAGGPGSATGDIELEHLDHKLLTLRLSPGGSADLLAATLFLDTVEQGRNAVEEDHSF
jgi:triphosphoribosyl-dephospho-CoA synthase